MPAAKILCKKLIARFDGTSGYPRGNENALSARVDILVDRAVNDDHAKYVVQTLLEDSGACPTVADLARVLLETKKFYGPPSKIGCGFCVEGWVRRWFLTSKNKGAEWTHERITQEQAKDLAPKLKPRDQAISEGVARCVCMGGIG